MKTILTTLTISILFSITTFASGDPVKGITILDAENITITTAGDATFFTTATVSSKDKSINFNTVEEVDFIQIFNAEGGLEFQLPAQSKKIKLNNSLFEKGDYKLAFIIKNNKEIKFTDLTIK